MSHAPRTLRPAALLVSLLASGCGDSGGSAPDPIPLLQERLLRVEETLKARDAEAASLRETAEKRRREVEALRAELAAFAAKSDAMEERLASAEERIRRLPEERPALAKESLPAPVKATILAADDAEGLYIISAGSNDGVKTSDELTVYRVDQFVAVVVVEKVFRDKAAVRVKMVQGKAFKKSDPRPGDKVASTD